MTVHNDFIVVETLIVCGVLTHTHTHHVINHAHQSINRTVYITIPADSMATKHPHSEFRVGTVI